MNKPHTVQPLFCVRNNRYKKYGYKRFIQKDRKCLYKDVRCLYKDILEWKVDIRCDVHIMIENVNKIIFYKALRFDILEKQQGS